MTADASVAEATAFGEPVMRDPDLDRRLAQDAMVTVPLLGPDELREIEAAYWRLVPPGEGGIVLDYLRQDRDLARELVELMAPVWERVVPQLFTRHYPVYTSFVVKHPGEDSGLFLHRDLHVDDERWRRTFSMWMPFVDTGPALDNGPLAFVRGSEQIRYGGFGPNAVGLYAPYDQALRERLEPQTVPAGTALVYDAKLLHESAPNRAASPRLAVGCLLAHRDHPVVQVMASGRRHRRVHAVDQDYFVAHAPAELAQSGMPERYPVIDEYDEEPGLTATEVLGPELAVLGSSREVIVPDDLEPLVGARWPLPGRKGRRPRHRHDLPITATDLAPPDVSALSGVAVVTSGSVGVSELVRRFRRVGPVPAAVPDLTVSLSPWRTRDATLLVIDPGGRASFTVPRGGRQAEVIAIEAPAVRAGACARDHVAELDLGRVVALEVDVTVHVWNDGPGSLVLLLRVPRHG